MARPGRLLAATLATAGLFGLAACGDTTDDASGTAPEEAQDCGTDTGETVEVEIPEFAFEPDPVSVEVCDSVVWVNSHTQPHTSTGDGAGTWNTGNIAPGEQSDPILFDEAGERTYICALHPFMTGTVEVA